MSEGRKIRDPLHEFISLTGEEVDIIDTTVFQRLRNIQQLACAHLVYPGARHSRFEHSLGVFHLAGMMAKKLELNSEETRIIKLSALLHDLGHGPFSHVSEDLLDLYTDKNKLPAVKEKEKIHELITGDIILNNQEIKKCLSTNEREQIVSLLLNGDEHQPLMRSIVSGLIDADKQDYLLRDSYFCGVKYGVFDKYQMLTEITVIKDKSEGTHHLGISEDGIHTLEQFFLAKYYITTQVYRHKVRLISDQMLVRAICLGIDIDGIEELNKLYTYDGTDAFINNYIRWDDGRFMAFFCDGNFSGKLCRTILKQICERKLFKRIYRKSLKDFPEMNRKALADITLPSSINTRRNIEEKLADLISETANQTISAESTIIYHYNIKSVKDNIRSEEPVLVNVSTGPRHFEEMSEIFSYVEKQLGESFIEVYCPVIYRNKRMRDKLINSLNMPITDILIENSKRKSDEHR